MYVKCLLQHYSFDMYVMDKRLRLLKKTRALEGQLTEYNGGQTD